MKNFAKPFLPVYMGHGAQVEFFLLKSVGDTVPLSAQQAVVKEYGAEAH